MTISGETEVKPNVLLPAGIKELTCVVSLFNGNVDMT